jgi:hypothetical protein
MIASHHAHLSKSYPTSKRQAVNGAVHNTTHHLPKRKPKLDCICNSFLVLKYMNAGSPIPSNTKTQVAETRDTTWAVSKQGTLKSAAK